MKRGCIRHLFRVWIAAGTLVFWLGAATPAFDAEDDPPSAVHIPHVNRAPAIEDFLDMEPAPAKVGELAKVEGFIQREPKDGEPATQRTVVYLGYDDQKLYAVFLAFDSQPDLIRAHMTRRENIFDDERVELMLDSFHDHRRAYVFSCNPFGIQLDALYTEGSGADDSFDTLWDSQGRVTGRGYVVWMAIPFRSLRFPKSGQDWGIILQRSIPRTNEQSYWPRVSSRISGRLNQEANLEGLEHISPGRNLQFIPYGVFRSFRTLNNRDAVHPFFESKAADARIGLESKAVLKDRLVLDFAMNPDFSQIESDEPQVTVNQRFEVFFPERRQFFLENGSYFETPINLLFTRRIADPFFVARLTGKVGRYAIGAIVADDRSPGQIVIASDELFHKRAHFAVARVNRDIGKESTIGLMYADRELNGAFNRVGGVDAHLKLGRNWTTTGQAVLSSTLLNDGSYSAGPALTLAAERRSRKLNSFSEYTDSGAGFQTQTGFFRRPGVRDARNFIRYQFRPEGKHLISHGPGTFTQAIWDRDGMRLNEFINVNYIFQLPRETFLGVFGNVGRDRLRPSDYSALSENRDYPLNHHGFFLETAIFKWLSAWGETGWGTGTNFVPAVGPPISARHHYIESGMTLRPVSRLTINNRYFLTRMHTGLDSASIFTDHIIRSKWNYQINREFSLRFITQYATTLADPNLTSLQTTKRLNFDFLFTYLLHPGTAVYVGYNSNLQNYDPALRLDLNGNILRTGGLTANDGRQWFVKMSYLLRF